MKNTKLIIIILLSLGLKVMGQTNNLIVFDQQGEKFWAILNGVRQNADAQTNVRITGLNSNTYSLKLIFQDSTKGAIDKTVYFQDMGTEETMHVVVKNNGERVLRYVSAVPLAQAAPPAPDESTVTYTTTAPAPPPAGNTTTVVTQQTTTAGGPATGASVGMTVNGMNMGVNVSGMPVQQTTVTTTTTTSSISSSSDAGYSQMPPPPAPQQSYVEGYNGPVGCPMPMAHEDYESAKNSIAGKSFEDTKLSTAKQVVSSNCLTSKQVEGIMKLFSFENTKLEFAKFAYAHTYDKANYFKVEDAFQFDSSSQELNNYISGH